MPRLAQIAVLAGIMLSTGTARAVGYICIAGLTGFSLLAADSSSASVGAMLRCFVASGDKGESWGQDNFVDLSQT